MTSTTSISRRDFMKAAGTAAVASSAAIAAGATSAQAGSAKADKLASSATSETTSAGGSWRDAPAPIDESQIVDTVTSDILVIGAGEAGLSCALKAAELGASVTVIEKSSQYNIRGWFFGAPNTKWTKELGIVIDEEDLIRDWIKNCGGRVNERVVRAFVEKSGPAIDWIGDKAVAGGLTPMVSNACYRGETYKEYPCGHLFLGGPKYTAMPAIGPMQDTMDIVYDQSVSLGVEYRYDTTAEQLVKDGDRVTGCVAKTADGYIKFVGTKGVVLATGDISGNEEMTRELAPLALKANGSKYTPAGVNTGDGQRMGLWAGGKLQEAPFPTMIHPQWFARQSYAFLFVNTRGERYMNEDTWVQVKSVGAIMQNEKEPYAFSIFDAGWKEDVPRSLEFGGSMFWDYHTHPYGQPWDSATDEKTIATAIKDGNGFQADTLEELADLIGVPRETFLATVERYNEMVSAGKDSDFGKRPELLFDIAEPPFTALKFGGALLCVPGGLEVNEHAQVLGDDGAPVEGLYAIGNVMGGLYGVDYPVLCLGNSNARCVTFGVIAAENALGVEE